MRTSLFSRATGPRGIQIPQYYSPPPKQLWIVNRQKRKGPETLKACLYPGTHATNSLFSIPQQRGACRTPVTSWRAARVFVPGQQLFQGDMKPLLIWLQWILQRSSTSVTQRMPYSWNSNSLWANFPDPSHFQNTLWLCTVLANNSEANLYILESLLRQMTSTIA